MSHETIYQHIWRDKANFFIVVKFGWPCYALHLLYVLFYGTCLKLNWSSSPLVLKLRNRYLEEYLLANLV